jgi:AsnC family.
MKSGYVLVKLEQTTGGTAKKAAAVALGLPRVERVDIVSGAFDMILHVAAASEPTEFALLAQARAIPGVIRALPCWVLTPNV